MQEHELHGGLTPLPVTVHGTGPMPAKGATIECRLGDKRIEGSVTRHQGLEGNWAFAWRFRSEVEPLAAYAFKLVTKDGTVLHAWTTRTTSGEG